MAQPQQAPVAPPAEYHTIYVGNLKPEVTEVMVFQHCKKVYESVEVFSVRICRDWHTQVSLGYGYVNLVKKEEAAILINLLSFTSILDQTIRVTWKRKEKLPADANLFIGNINLNCHEKEVYEAFKDFGKIASCSVKRFEKAQTCCIQFESVDDAAKCIESCNKKTFFGGPINVAVFIPKAQRKSKFTNVYLKNFPSTYTEMDLCKFFGFDKFGPGEQITSVYIGVTPTGERVVKEQDGLKTSFGFVNFVTHELAVEMIEKFNGFAVKQEVPDVPETKEGESNEAEKKTKTLIYSIEVVRALSKAERQKSFSKTSNAELYKNCLYIGFVPKDVSRDELIQLFSRNNTVAIKSFNLAVDNDKMSRGFAYCYFEDNASALKTVEEFNGYELKGARIKVELYKSKEKLLAERALHRPPMNQQHYQFPYPPQQRYPFKGNNMPGMGGMGMGNTNQSRKRNNNYINNPKPNQPRRQQQQQIQQQQIAPPPVVVEQQVSIRIEAFNDQEFNTMSLEEKHENFGERIYTFISEAYPEANPGRITGMILESFKNNFEHLNTIITNGQIAGKIEEAINVFKQHETSAPAAQ